MQTGTPGAISLVAATKITSTLAGDPLHVAHRLTLEFRIPEPRAGALLLVEAATLAVARGRARPARGPVIS